MLSEQERRAIRRHAKVIEDYEANREHEFRRIIAPIWGRAEAIWRQINDERLRSPEGFEAFTYVAKQIRTDPALVAEFRSFVGPLREGMSRFDQAHRPSVKPFDTPGQLVAYIDYELDWIGRRRAELLAYTELGRRVLESEGRTHRPGEPPDYPEKEARAHYREARRRALAFVTVAPSLPNLIPERIDPVIGLQDIRAVFAGLLTEGVEELSFSIGTPVRLTSEDRPGPNVGTLTAPWLRDLADLRTLFASRLDDDLSYLRAEVRLPPDEAESQGWPQDPEFLPLPEGMGDGPPIIREWKSFRYQSPREMIPGRRLVMIQRHVFTGTADAASLSDFDRWSDAAGQCLAARPTADPDVGFSRRTPQVRWLDYLLDVALQKVEGCPLRARLWSPADPGLFGGFDSGSPFYVTLSLNVFRSSVDVIDLILHHAPSLWGNTKENRSTLVSVPGASPVSSENVSIEARHPAET